MKLRQVTALLLALLLLLNASPLVLAAEPPVQSDPAPEAAEEASVPAPTETEPETEPETVSETEPETEPPEAETEPETTPTEPEPETLPVITAEEVREVLAADVGAARLDSYQQYLAYFYLTDSALNYFLGTEELPFQTYVEYADEDMRTELAAWRLLNMGAGEVATYTAAEVDFYMFLVFDILYQETARDTTLENAKTAADILHLSLLDTFADAGKDWTGATELTMENAGPIIDTAAMDKNLKFFKGVEALGITAEVLEKVISVCKTVDDLIYKLSVLVQLNEASREVSDILNRLYESSDNELMRLACERLAIIASGTVTDEQIIDVICGEAMIVEPTKYALNELWEGALQTSPLGQGMMLGHGVGKLACNALWSTNAVVENWYSMQKVCTFKEALEDVVIRYRDQFESNPTYENAKLFNQAARMYLDTLSVGMEYAVNFFKAARGGGAYGWIYRNLIGQEDYDAMLADLEGVDFGVTLAITLANNLTYNDYLTAVDAERETVDWEETPCDADAEEVQQMLSSLPEILFMLTSQTVSGDTTYVQSHTTYSNYTFTGGVLDLNGQTLTVGGDFYLTGGTLRINGGTLDIRGDLHFEGGTLNVSGGTVRVGGDFIYARINNEGSYFAAKIGAALRMENDADRITVGGDLISYGDSGHFYCSAGEMRVGGSWTNYSLNSTPSGSFRMVFTGTEDLKLCGTDEIYVPAMVIENAAGRQITMEGTVSTDSLEGGDMTIHASKSPRLNFAVTSGSLDIRGDAGLSVRTRAGGDIRFDGNASVGGIILCGNSLDVKGDLWISGTTTLGDSATGRTGTLTVGGRLIHKASGLTLNGGTVTVAGDYVYGSINSSGTYISADITAQLRMDKDEDLIVIGGNLITFGNSGHLYCTAGEMRVGGSWTNYSLNSTPSGSFRMVFTGTEDLKLCGTDEIYVPTLVIENAAGRQITMEGTVSTDSLEGGDMTIHANKSPRLNFAVTSGSLDIRGNAGLSVRTRAGGDIRFDGNASVGGILLCGNSLDVKGDLWIGGTTTLGDSATGRTGTLTVGGRLVHKESFLILNGGTVTVTGDYVFANIGSDGTYMSTDTGTYLRMDRDEDMIVIGGDLITFGNYGYFNCSAGEMRLGGSWTNYCLAAVPSGTFTMILTGTGSGTLYGMNEIYVPTLIIENASQRNITMRGTVKAGTLMGEKMHLTAYSTPVLSFDALVGSVTIDGSVNLAAARTAGGITVNGDLYSSGLVMGANALDVAGDLYLNANKTLVFGASGSLNVGGDLRMKAGTLSLGRTASVGGSVYQAGGELKVNQCGVFIAGDYRIQGADESTGEVVWINSTGNLTMTADAGCVVVCGEFHMQSANSHSSRLTAGTLAVMGDFFQHAGHSANFAAGGTHTVLLCGSAPQTVTFESDGSRFNILQLSGYAENYTFDPDPCWDTLEEAVEVPDEYYGSVVREGSCGTGVAYALTERGVLIISGTGPMKNYTGKSAMPWYADRDGIRTVIIREGVTSIGDYAFYAMPIHAVRIPDSVTAIGSYAFKGCENLGGVVLPAGLTRLGESAFYGCAGLKAIEIPASLWTIQPYTFKNCTALESLTFHEGNLQKIADGAFYGTALTEVTLPDCLGVLDVYAFKNCARLASVTLGSGLTQIREAVFYGTALSEITIPAGVTVIKPYAFKNCVKLTAVDLPDSLTGVEEAAFYGCTALASVRIPDAVTAIGNYAFRKCTGLTDVEFGTGLTTVGESSFYGCTGLTELVIPGSVTTIKGYAFKGCTAVASVSLPDSLKTLGDSAFHTCTGLKTIVIPAGVTAIGEYCFSGSRNLWQITFEADAPAIGTGAFKGLTATACYPGGNATWTTAVMQNYGGTITWKAV